ncbi:antibiotic biosynthesis monooxygenase [Shimia sp. R11_0]|uniref:putative quinol monooxygenase n=1 Tax=Shimia sp. R11_0 TaxID=2821096 RepID=UPI001ADCF3C6|nr:antibiotic biosynthesis monooxygenase [Shimia sp. R11_0]MBO9479241.1 antibiotic biosynthesis monooxygenase [Shimia sp. R11_0]
MIVLTGYIDVPKDRLSDVSEALPEHITLTRAEPGCLSFNVEPDAQTPGRFLVSECFVDRIAFQHHQTRTQNSAWAVITQGIPRQYQIEDDTE